MQKILAFYDDGDALYCVGPVDSKEEAADYARNYFLEYYWVSDDVTVDSPWEPYFDAEVEYITALPNNRRWGDDKDLADIEMGYIHSVGALAVQVTVRWEYDLPAE